MHLLQQPEPFPDKPGGDRLAGWLPAQHLAARFADASPERVIAEADLRLRPVAVPRLTDDLRQAMLAVVAVVPANDVQLRQTVVRDLLSRVFKR